MRIFAKSDIGKSREVNEDSYFVSDEEIGIDLFILSDGMGGYHGGRVASSLAVEAAKSYITTNYEITFDDKEDIKKLVNGAIEYANMIVNEKAKEDEDLKYMGATIEIALIIKDDIYIGHAGDSSIYRLRKNFFRKLTKDHSYIENLIDEGKITREEGRTHPNKNMVTKAVGTGKLVEADVFNKKLLKDDILLMCSDGLTNMVLEERIEEILRTSANPAEDLINEANANGGLDNITAIVVKK